MGKCIANDYVLSDLDRMEIFNNGGLPQGVTIEKIKQGFSTPRNQLIAEVLFRSNLIEKWGRGIQEIIRSCIAAGDPEPEFISDQVEFKVVFRFPEERKPEETVLKIPHQQLTKRQREIIEILSKTNDLNINNIHNQLQDKTSERSLRRDLAKLRGLGIVQMLGHTHAVVWSVLPPSKPTSS